MIEPGDMFTFNVGNDDFAKEDKIFIFSQRDLHEMITVYINKVYIVLSVMPGENKYQGNTYTCLCVESVLSFNDADLLNSYAMLKMEKLSLG